MHIAAVMTVFNRREKTLACLRALQAGAARIPQLRLSVCLTDDGSTDGTRAAVAAEFPEVLVLGGDGSLYWNGGMRKAMAAAIALHPDFYLWLNDDVELAADAIDRLLETASAPGRASAVGPIVVGSTADPVKGNTTYGGRLRSSALRPLHFSLVEPGAEPVPCETMNANCVLLPAAVVGALGNLDAAFVHGLGDFDYGLRARRAGYELLVCPGHIGRCAAVSDRGDSKKAFTSMRVAWRRISGPKAFPPAAWRTFTRRYGGPFWLAYWVKPYVRALWLGLLRGGV